MAGVPNSHKLEQQIDAALADAENCILEKDLMAIASKIAALCNQLKTATCVPCLPRKIPAKLTDSYTTYLKQCNALKRHVCGRCLVAYRYKKQLKQHETTSYFKADVTSPDTATAPLQQDLSAEFICFHCDCVFMSMKALECHMHVAHLDVRQTFNCALCTGKKSFVEYDKFVNHLCQKHNEKQEEVEEDVPRLSNFRLDFKTHGHIANQEVYDAFKEGCLVDVTSAAPKLPDVDPSQITKEVLSQYDHVVTFKPEQRMALHEELRFQWRNIRTAKVVELGRGTKKIYQIRMNPTSEDPLEDMRRYCRAVFFQQYTQYKMGLRVATLLYKQETNEFSVGYCGSNSNLLGVAVFIQDESGLDKCLEKYVTFEAVSEAMYSMKGNSSTSINCLLSLCIDIYPLDLPKL